MYLALCPRKRTLMGWVTGLRCPQLPVGLGPFWSSGRLRQEEGKVGAFFFQPLPARLWVVFSSWRPWLLVCPPISQWVWELLPLSPSRPGGFQGGVGGGGSTITSPCVPPHPFLVSLRLLFFLVESLFIKPHDLWLRAMCFLLGCD